MEADRLWKAAFGTFPQPLENATRFPQLPQPLLDRSKEWIEETTGGGSKSDDR
jgi:hypothetical protein